MSVTLYQLRHTYASLLSDGGIETTALADLMGHASVRTLQRYVTNTYQHHRDAVDNLERNLQGVLAMGVRVEKKSTAKVSVPAE